MARTPDKDRSAKYRAAHRKEVNARQQAQYEADRRLREAHRDEWESYYGAALEGRLDTP